MASTPVNALMSAQKTGDSGLQAALHPLPLLEISDYITRSHQRGYKGAIVGALMGQQNGREITIEHSFTCKTAKKPQGFYELDEDWFLARLEQRRPNPLHIPIHMQFIAQNESAILLGFHIEGVLRPVAGDPLPLTIYESNLEADDSSDSSAKDEASATAASAAVKSSGEDKEMKDSEAPAKMVLKFRELPYTTETGEAEMIAMQFIREGGAYATADDKRIMEQFDRKIAIDDGKGKRRAVTQEETKARTTKTAASAAGGLSSSTSTSAGAFTTDPSATSTSSSANNNTRSNRAANLTKPEAEYMSALQAKYSAIKMMKSRVDLIVAYLERLPPDFVSGSNSNGGQTITSAKGKGTTQRQKQYTTPSHNILRQIQALVTNIELATPTQREGSSAASTTLEKEILQETNDVNLVALISDVLSSVSDVRELGKKFAVVEAQKNQKAR
ncbi:hypothetical protein B0T17DRAFT_506167 [Bombardia bombarda]|uniref:COP9 signalosome complex subunit 6 n=1 Tax=Bombardia bombarda TaxID=252184 RepID=A0AA39XA13_9PEZI|nr:hypothetical protein B0T17DRAFT_506167 [Bombardia bombarda]